MAWLDALPTEGREMSRSDLSMRYAREEGVAMVLASMAMLLLMALGAALIMVTTTENAIASNFRAAGEAFYAADAVLTRALIDLRDLPNWDQALDGSVRSSLAAGAPSGLRRLSDGSTVDFARVISLANCRKRSPCSPVDETAVTDERPWGANNPHWQPYAFGTLDELAGAAPQGSPFYVVALIADDPAENDADPLHDGLVVGPLPNPGRHVLMVRGEAFGPRGAHRAVEAVVFRFRLDEADPASPLRLRMLRWRELR